MFDDNQLLFKSNDVKKLPLKDFFDDLSKFNHCHLPGGPAGGQFCSDSGGEASGSFSPFVGVPTVAPDPNPVGDGFNKTVAELIADGKAMDKGMVDTSVELKEINDLDAAIAKTQKNISTAFDKMHKSDDQAVQDKLWEKINREDIKQLKLTRQRDALLEQNDSYMYRRIEQQVGADYNKSIQPTSTGLQPNTLSVNSARMGPIWLGNIIGDGGVPLSQHPKFQPVTDTSRAHADHNSGIFMHPHSDTGTAVHEMGHWLEFSRQDVYSASVGFLNMRFQDSRNMPGAGTIRPLSAITGHAGYGNKEIAFSDKFSNPYTGKIYSNPSAVQNVFATEIVSMGFEKMFRNPIKFRHEDPEHYHFTLGVMKNVAHTKAPGRANFNTEGAWSIGHIFDAFKESGAI